MTHCPNFRDVIFTAAELHAAGTVKKTHKQLFFGDKILDLETDFWKLGCVPVLWSLIRILRASMVQTDTEIAEKYSNKRYAVDMLSNTLNTASYS